MTASYQKLFHPDPHIGFLSYAQDLNNQLATGAIPAAQAVETSRLIWNARVDAAVTGALAVMVLLLLDEALYEWSRILGKRAPVWHDR